MSELVRHEAYKESGILWLPQIPEHWQRNKISRISRLTVGWTPPTGDASSFEGDNLWANISDLGPRTLTDTAKRISDEAVAASRIVKSPKGSLLFSFKLSVGQVSFAGADMYTNEAIATFLETRDVALPYAYYAFPIFIVENASENIYGAKILNQSLIGSAQIALPPVNEQLSIASYLDHETAEIDAFIADQEELIELLKDRRAATITQSVTRGLDLSADMKTTDVNWFPVIPKHWVMQKGSRSTRLIQTGPFGSQVHASDYVDGGTPLINPKHIVDGRIVPDWKNSVGTELSEELGRHRLMRGDVIAARRGELGRSAVVTDEEDGYLCGTGSLIIRVREDTYHPRFFQLVFSSKQNRDALLQESVGATMDNLSAETIANLRLPAPPISEQVQILEYLDFEISEIDAAITDAKEAIELSKERRAALISAAVTGKIDVRNHITAELGAA